MIENEVAIVASGTETTELQGTTEEVQSGCTTRAGARLSTWLRACRIQHWAKNVLFFVPIILGHRFTFNGLAHTAVGAVIFGICSSGVYILNDVLDEHSDRSHPWKRNRPLASGEISRRRGAVAGIILIALAVGFAVFLSTSFAVSIALYFVATSAYSLGVKRTPLLDVFVLSSFYTLRMWAGATITSTKLSLWFLAFSLFIFLSLAMAKRYSELVDGECISSTLASRGYTNHDKQLLMTIGIASCFSAVVVLSMYVHSAEVSALYRRPGGLLLLCPLVLYWISNVWLKACRGELNGDPVVLELKDSVTYWVVLIGVAVMLLCH